MLRKLSFKHFLVLLTILTSFATFEGMPDGTWRGLILLIAILLVIALVLSTIETRIQQSKWSDKRKSFALGAIVPLTIFIFLFALLWQLGYTLDKTESPGSGVSIDIASPGPDEIVDRAQQVRETFSGKLPAGMHAKTPTPDSNFSSKPFIIPTFAGYLYF